MGAKKIDKKCGHCRVWKPVGEFYISKKEPLIYDGYCKPCRREKDRDRAERRNKVYEQMKRKDPLYHRRRKLLALYGLTHEQWMEMYKTQKGRCAICRAREKRVLYGNVAHMAVDHNHTTGQVRGLLCSGCNTKLNAIEDEQFMLLAKAYLRKHGYRFTTVRKKHGQKKKG